MEYNALKVEQGHIIASANTLQQGAAPLPLDGMTQSRNGSPALLAKMTHTARALTPESTAGGNKGMVAMKGESSNAATGPSHSIANVRKHPSSRTIAGLRWGIEITGGKHPTHGRVAASFKDSLPFRPPKTDSQEYGVVDVREISTSELWALCEKAPKEMSKLLSELNRKTVSISGRTPSLRIVQDEFSTTLTMVLLWRIYSLDRPLFQRLVEFSPPSVITQLMALDPNMDLVVYRAGVRKSLTPVS